MSFTKKHIGSGLYLILEIGRYKLRGVVIRFKHTKIDIVHYREKRQDQSFFMHNRCVNLRGLTENIEDIIVSIEEDINFTFDEIICNYSFGDIYVGNKTLSYKRSKPNSFINIDEVEKIIEKSQKLACKKIASELHDSYGRSLDEYHIIISRIGNIKIDSLAYKKILQKTGTHITIQLLNILIEKSEYLKYKRISKKIGKKITKILPTEYCISKLIINKNACIIDIGTYTTSVTVKKDGEIFGVVQFPSGIHHLVSEIQKNYSLSSSQVLEDLALEEVYISEKNIFLSYWKESVAISLKEICGNENCPNSFYLWGGGNTNSFMSESLKDIAFSSYDISMNGKIEFIREDMGSLLSRVHNIQIQHIYSVPLSIYALILETKNILVSENNVLGKSLEQALTKLGY